jgi:hypothetical protein
MKDFVREGKEIGCEFAFFEDSRALEHKSGWCHRVDPDNMKAYEAVFNKTAYEETTRNTSTVNMDKDDPVLELIRKSGFEYADKRPNNGSLWIIAGENEGKALTEQCKKLGVSFAFTSKGGRASKKRPAWYSI